MTDLTKYYAYDDVNRLVSKQWLSSGTTQVYAFSYDYDAANNRKKMRRESTYGDELESAYYAYDDANELVRRLSMPGNVATYYGYDANGSMLRTLEGSDATYFEYNVQKLISKITPPVGSPWEFSYDGQLNRYLINEGGTSYYLLWEGLNCLEKRELGGALHTRYTYGYTRLPGIGGCIEIYLESTGKTYMLVYDHRGTGHVLLDQDQTEIGRRLYDAFGVILSQTGSRRLVGRNN